MNIVLGISSGIAGYKMTDLARILKKKGHDVQCILTEKAQHIVSPQELEEITGNQVFVNLFDKNFSKETVLKERKVDHIEVAKKADIFVIAPATANTLAKLSAGMADDFLTTAVLATHAPVLICPSMNDVMWTHQTVQDNIKKLESYDYRVMRPDSGALACGTEGVGRLPDSASIAAEIEHILDVSISLKGKKILVTSGATIEPIDSARILTNRSSGKMGIAIAEECFKRGAEVHLLRARLSAATHLPVSKETFQSTKELEDLMEKNAKQSDIVFHVAAVSDFTVQPFEGKIESDKPMTLTLIPTKKIINKVKHWNPGIILIGFKAVYGVKNLDKKIQEKMNESKADYMIVNDISRADIGFESDENEVILFDKKMNKTILKKLSKKELAKKILYEILY